MDHTQGALQRPPHRSLAQPSVSAKPVRFGIAASAPMPARSMDGDAVRIQAALLSMRQHITRRQKIAAVARWVGWSVVYGAAFALLAVSQPGGVL